MANRTHNTVPPDALFRLAQQGYLVEADELARSAATPGFKRLLELFDDYPEFLASHRSDYLDPLPSGDSGAPRVIDFDDSSEPIRKLVACINLAAACELFGGWTIPVSQLESAQLRAYVLEATNEIEGRNENAASLLAAKLNSGDACRVIHMLKLLGWVAPDLASSRQLSLGASGGTRDRQAIHQTPVVRYQRHDPLSMDTRPETVSFRAAHREVDDIVLVDNDPKMKARYDELNTRNNVLALNLDASEALREIGRRIGKNALAPRSFVVGFRIDHRMIPDAGSFLKLLGSVITETACLVITIGAGHSNKEFKGRLQKMEELMAALDGYGLNPVKIKWHRGDSLAERRENPLFGAPTYATYEVLYCELIRSRITS